MPETLFECRERAAEALVPFMLTGADGDAAFALKAAKQALDAYRPMTPREIQLTAQSLALTFTSLNCLRAVAAGKDLSIQTIIDLNEAAIKLDRQATSNGKALDVKQRERQCAPQRLNVAAIAWDEAMFKKVMKRARRFLDDADALAPDPLYAPKPNAPLLDIAVGEEVTLEVLIRQCNAINPGKPW